ncbi:hypothetical protein DFH06DRAFT_1374262 [Mycena polygramma]|nr:hypothetical protein DFH06DRAFT_1374262 [Mycena polygramma]
MVANVHTNYFELLASVNVTLQRYMWFVDMPPTSFLGLKPGFAMSSASAQVRWNYPLAVDSGYLVWHFTAVRDPVRQRPQRWKPVYSADMARPDSRLISWANFEDVHVWSRLALVCLSYPRARCPEEINCPDISAKEKMTGKLERHHSTAVDALTFRPMEQQSGQSKLSARSELSRPRLGLRPQRYPVYLDQSTGTARIPESTETEEKRHTCIGIARFAIGARARTIVDVIGSKDENNIKHACCPVSTICKPLCIRAHERATCDGLSPPERSEGIGARSERTGLER